MSMRNHNILNSLVSLLLVFLIGILGLLVPQFVVSQIDRKLDIKLRNAETRHVISANIIYSLATLEALFYQMALSRNPDLADLLRGDILEEITTMEATLTVLERGGVVSHIVHMNSVGTDQFAEKLVYIPDPNQFYKLETIDLLPKLRQLVEKEHELELLINEVSDQNLTVTNHEAVEQRIGLFIKQLPTHFVRMKENANRLVFQSNQEVQKYKASLLQKRSSYLVHQGLFSFTILVIVIFIACRLIRQANQTNRRLVEHSWELVDLAQKADAANKAKSSFLANMSHEIRTPLNAIMGFIDLLHAGEKDPDRLDYLKTIRRASNNLLQIIQDVLDFSKIESGKVDLEEVSFSPYDEFLSMGELFTARASEKNITFISNISKEMPTLLRGDLMRFKQVTMNLLSNAVKFTDNGKKIVYEVRYAAGILTVDVIDQGIGISAVEQERVFEAFTQADGSTTRKFGGTGLGLAISSQLAEMLGGKLTLVSAPGAGSHFTFSVPVAVELEEVRSQDASRLAERGIPGHFLVAEDNRVNQKFMTALLKSVGATCDIAADGHEAVDLFRYRAYDAILMDENMPNMSGIEAAKAILMLENEKSLLHTPLIAVTANAVQGERDRFLEAGFDEFLTKPLNRDNLLRALWALTRESRETTRQRTAVTPMVTGGMQPG